MRVVFFGTPYFAAKVAKHLIAHQVEICAAVTRPDKPRGRSLKPRFSALKQMMLEEFPEIPLYQPDKVSTESFGAELARYGADLFVVVAYGEIIKQHILDMPRLACLNVHASLLPLYRGAAPIHFALLSGEKKTGITIIEMVAKMDAGPILAQQEVEIGERETFFELEEKLCAVGAEQLLKVIDNYAQGEVKKIAQDESQATFTTKIDPSLAQLDWIEPAEVLYGRIRAFTPRPGAWCLARFGDKVKRLKVVDARLASGEGKAGSTLAYSEQGWRIACGKGALEILALQVEGKKALSIGQFWRGMQVPPVLI